VSGFFERRKRILAETVQAFKAGMRGDRYALPKDLERDPESRPQAPAPPDKYDQLRKLNELREVGAVTDEEYEREKRKLLSRD
jgi:hypothetical protein